MISPPPESLRRPGRGIHTLVAPLLGLVFVIAGSTKSLDLPPFVSTIAELTGAPWGAAMVLALVLIASEIIGGLLMILKIHSRAAALALSALMVAFILGRLVMNAEALAFHCNCFGPLTPTMSHLERLAFDCVLLDLLLVAALTGGPRTTRLSRAKPIALALLATLQIAGLAAASRETLPELSGALQHAARLDPLFAATRGNRAILLLDLADFTCSACYDDIYRTADTISRPQQPADGHRALILLKRSMWSPAQAEARARRWQATSGITLPTFTIEDSLFSPNDGPASSVVVFDRRGAELLRETFPLGAQKRHHLVELLFSDQRGTN